MNEIPPHEIPAFDAAVAEADRRRGVVRRRTRIASAAAVLLVVAGSVGLAGRVGRVGDDRSVDLAAEGGSDPADAGVSTTVPADPLATTTTSEVDPPSTTITVVDPPAPTTTTTAVVAGVPRVVGIAADITRTDGGYAEGTITVTFDRPVVLGPAELAAMYLVVHAGDATCDGPDGNAHEVLSGNGTDVLVLDATSLHAGTSYVTIAPGFVTDLSGRFENAAVACRAVPTTDSSGG